MKRPVVLAVLAAAAAVPASAQAQALPPSLTLDTSYAFSGFGEYDFAVGTVATDEATAAGTDPARNRLYAVGATAGAAGTEVAVVARRSDGTLDRTFSGDGVLAVAFGAGDARATDVAVLPDGRLRVLATVDAGTPAADLAILGLLPDGTRDPAFGTDGIVRFGGVAEETAARLDADAAGRLVVTGTAGTGAAADTLVAVREADGGAAAFGSGGLVVTDRGAGGADRGADVAWGPTGVVVLTELGTADAPAGAVLRALRPDGTADTAFSGDGDLILSPGGAATTAGGIEIAAGAVWVTGSTVVDADRDAYLARVALDGADPQVRRFDLRGTTFPESQQVASEGLDLTLVPGEPDTLVVGGETSTDAGTEPSAAAFNELSRPVADLQTVDLVVPVEGQGSAVGVAAGSGGEVAVTAALTDFSVETGSGTLDTSIGMGRLLVDAEKRCDLSLVVASPLELRLAGRAPGVATLRVTNVGQRACGGTLTAGAPFATEPAAIATGPLGPGQGVTIPATVGWTAPTLPETARIAFTLAAAGDVDLGDNQATLGARFRFCDVGVRAFRAPRLLSTEGERTLTLSVRNRGTAACPVEPTILGTPGVRLGRGARYTVAAGQSVSDDMRMRLSPRAAPGTTAQLSLRVPSAPDVTPADNSTVLRAVVVRPGDTNLRVTRDGRRISGTAGRGRAPGQSSRSLRVRRVDVALQLLGKRCRWVSGPRGRLVGGGTTGNRRCDAPVWLKARGTSRWSFRLRRPLEAGRYRVVSRAVLRNGIAEARFSRSDRNERTIRVR